MNYLAMQEKNLADKLADSIIEKRVKELGKQISQYQRNNSILSDIGDCERQMVYSVLDWDKKPLHDAELQARFEAGKTAEREIVRELEGLGFDVVMSQAPILIKNRKGELIASGKIDGFIKYEGRNVPMEIKSMNPNIFNQVKSVTDFQKKPWLRKYTRQLMMYMFGNNEEEGLFIVTDCLGHWKILPLYLDYAEAEQILQRLERVHDHIQAKSYPKRIVYDQSICGKCPFASICLQDILNTEADIMDDPEIESIIDRHEEIKPIAKEYDDLHDQIKGIFKDKEKSIVGTKYIIQNIPSQRTVYELPDDVKEQINEIKSQFAKPVPLTRLVIEKIGR